MAGTDDIDLIEQAEETLRKSLSLDGASPFLAHHRVADQRKVTDSVRLMVNGNDRALAWLFRKYPRVGVWSAAMALAEKYGDDGDHNVYLPLGKGYGYMTGVLPESRNVLRQQFRHAVMQLSLPLPVEGDVIKWGGTTVLRPHPIDEFFSQVGVALTQAKDLAQIFQKHACESGAPSAQDSTTKLSQWEHEAVALFCPPHLRRLPKAILHDWSGYHAGLYARLLAGDLPDTEFAGVFSRVVEKLPARKAEFAPRLVCHEAELFIRDGSTAVGFHAILESNERRVRPRGELRLLAPWPRSVECWASNAERSTARTISVLGGGTSFLLFDSASGRSIAVVDSPQLTLTISYREIAVVSREPFTLGEKSGEAAGIGAYILYATVEAPITLSSATHKIELVPRQRPSIKVLADSVIGRSGDELLLAGVWGVEVELPASHELSDAHIELHASHPSLSESPVVIPRELSSRATLQIDLTGILPETGEFGMLKLELKQPGNDRVLYREKAWHWPGLKSLKNGAIFSAPSVPVNFDEKRSLHIKPNAAGALVVMPADQIPYLVARLVFNASGDHAGECDPLAQFTLFPPGVSLIFREANGNERPLPHGQMLALSPEDGSEIIVRTSQPSAELDVKGVLESVSFDRFGRRILKSSGLAGSGSGPTGHLGILYRDSIQFSWLKLLEIAAVATVKQFAVAATLGEVTVTIEFLTEPHRLRLSGRGLHFGEEFSLLESGAGLTVSRAEGGNSVAVNLSTAVLPCADVYIVALEVDFGDGRWRTLTNARRDRYEWAVYHSLHNKIAIDVSLTTLGLLLRATDVMQRCAALSVWDSIKKFVLPLWRESIAALVSEMPVDWSTLLRAAAAGWDAEASVTWVPIHHPIEEFVYLFSAPLEYFGAFDGNNDGRGNDHIAWLQRFASRRRFLADFMLEQNIYSLFLASFENHREADDNRNLPLRGFKFGSFEKALAIAVPEERESLWTPRQDRLSLAHHRWCCERYAERLGNVHVPGHNKHRIDDLLEVCRFAAPVMAQFEGVGALHLPCPELLYVAGKPSELLAYAPLVLSLLAKYSRAGGVAFLGEQRSSEHKNVTLRRAMIMDFVSEFGVRCKKSDSEILRTFGLLIRLGPELFAFYLLLWELAIGGDSIYE